MPNAEFFNEFGVFALRDFLGRDFCREICGEISRSVKNSEDSFRGGVYMPCEGRERVNLDLKSRLEVKNFEPSIVAKVRERFSDVLPDLESYFKIKLREAQNPKFTVYKKGDFFKPHTDAALTKDSPQSIIDRKIGIIVFLNDESQVPAKDKYCGGNLTFHGLMPDSPFAKFGLPLIGEKGMLVAFRPDIMHEVTPVTHGERFVIVNWYV